MSGNGIDEQIEEFKVIFEYFGWDGEQPIAKKMVKEVLVSLGQNPSDSDMAHINKLIVEQGDKPITFPIFLELMTYKMQGEEAEKQLLSAFNVFDRNSNGEIEI